MWRKEGEVLRSGYKYRVLKDGELTVKHALYNDSGAYECVARTNRILVEAFTELVVRGESKRMSVRKLFSMRHVLCDS